MKKLIVGLGNPGLKYKNTRHNAGFLYVDFIAKQRDVKFKKNKGLHAEIAEDVDFILLKPTTFMNNSGVAVHAAADYFNIPYETITVIHDDSDITFGEFKVQSERGSAGHKGIESINNELHTNSYTRIRIGVRPPGNTLKAETFVLQRFGREEQKRLTDVFKTIII